MAGMMRGMAEQHWRERLARWRRSGLSVREFCWREELSEPSFYVWRRRLKDSTEGEGSQDGVRFVPVQVVDAAGKAVNSGEAETAGVGGKRPADPRGCRDACRGEFGVGGATRVASLRASRGRVV